MDELLAMGFDHEAARTALSMNNHNFDNALTMLLSQASHEQALSFPVATATPRAPLPASNPAGNAQSLTPLQQPVQQPPSAAAGAAAGAAVTSAFPERPGAREARDPAVEALAGGLAADRPAVNALVELVDKLLANPSDQTISVLLLKGKWAPIKAAAGDAGLAFLQHLGYALRSGFWCLSADAAAAKSGVGSAQATWLAARGALGRAMGDELYLLAESLAESKAAAVSAAIAARQTMRSKPTKSEPEPPAPSTRLVFHPKGSTPVQPSAHVLERRFAPDDLLSDAVHFLGSLPEDSSVVEGSHSWELVASGHDAPFWWCHGIEIVDVTMRPERALTVADARRTLQGLELWPSAQLAIRPVPLGAGSDLSSASRPPSAPAVSRNGSATTTPASGSSGGLCLSGGQTAGPRPTPADVLKSVVGRPTKGATASGSGGSSGAAATPHARSHYNVQASAAAAAEARFAAANKASTGSKPPSSKSTEATPPSTVAQPTGAAPPPPAATSVPNSAVPVASGFPGWGAPSPANNGSSNASSTTANTTTAAATPPSSTSGEALAALVAMGFGEAAARKALADAGGNQERAVDILLG